MAIAIVGQSVTNLSPAATSHTFSFTVPAGADTLIVLMTMRTATGGLAATISSITHNGNALTAGFNNFAAGTFDINTLVAYQRSPDIGSFNVVIDCANVAGGTAWCLALSGVIGSGNPVGGTNAQRTSSSTATSVGLGLTPASGSLLLTTMASGNNPGTITAFSGASFVDAATGRYSPNGDMPATHRYRLNAAASSTSVSATFSDASPNSGGLLAEILLGVSVTDTDVAGTVAVAVAISGSTGAAGGGEILNASFRELTAWTEILSLQPDAAGVDRRIISAGVVGNPTLTLDQLAANRNYSWAYRLSDGNVRIDTASSTQSLTPHHLALVHNGAFGQDIYFNGIGAGQLINGGGLAGELVIATGGERIGAHGAASPGPYTGLIGRYLLYQSAMTPGQVRLLALSETDPDALWGVGAEDDARVANQSLVACPLHSELDGQPDAIITPVILDPSGGTRIITSVTQPANGTLTISELSLVYQPTRGWQGTDSATYTASDGIKSSAGKLTFRQKRPALKCSNDAITCASGGTVTFDPRLNDVGAGTLNIISQGGAVNGTVAKNANGSLSYAHAGAGSADSFTYIVQDDWSQQSATVSVTIAAGSFLQAADVSSSTNQGVAVDIDVVAAASASANLLPIVVAPGSITTPTMGGTTALQTDGRIRYSPVTGQSGYTDQFNFTLKPSAAATPTDVGTASVQVLAVGTGNLPKLQPVPAVSRWHCVGFSQSGSKAEYGSGRAGFAAAVAASNLVAGDVIVLADGTYSGAQLELTRSGTASTDGHNHIMIRARTHGKAIIDHQLVIHGAYIWITGVKFTYNDVDNPNYQSSGQAILTDQSGFWLTNCMFTGYAFINIWPNDTNIRICYNTVAATTLTSGTDTGVFITMLCQQNDRPPGDTEIAWNRVTLNNPGPQRNVMILHPSHSNGANSAFVQREFNFHHNHCVGPWLECMYLKRNIRVEFNYFEWLAVSGATTTHNMTFRHGLLTTSPQYDTGGIIRGNRFRSARTVTMILNGAGICITNNVMEGGGAGDIKCYAGNNIDGSSPPPPRDGCDNIQLVENPGFGSVDIGTIGGNLGSNTTLAGRNGRPDNVRLYRGDSDWNPAMRYGSGSSASQVSFLGGYGTGSAAKVITITASNLASAGCDPM